VAKRIIWLRRKMNGKVDNLDKKGDGRQSTDDWPRREVNGIIEHWLAQKVDDNLDG
jgi:hypothetical protein